MRAGSIALVLISLAANAGEKPLVPFPDDVNIAVVGEDLKVYGLPLMAYEFYSRQSQQELANFYRNTWSNAASDSDVEQPFLETRIGSWLALSRLEKNHNITVQFKEEGIKGTHVLIGLSPLPEFLLNDRDNQMEIHVPRLGGAKIASVVESRDKGKISEVYWLESQDTVDVFLERYKAHFESKKSQIRGYRIVKDESSKASYGNLTVDDAKASYRFDVTRGEDKKTRIVAIWQPR